MEAVLEFFYICRNLEPYIVVKKTLIKISCVAFCHSLGPWKSKFPCQSKFVSAQLLTVFILSLLFKVPELAGFWLLTILLQLPLQAFLLLNEDLIILPIERAVNIIMVIMIIVQLVTGFYALRKITRHQARKFHLHQFHLNRKWN